MWRHYLKAELRNFRKHKIFTTINVVGLAVGMACCVLVLLYVQHELNYDRYHDKAERIYRVVGESINPYEVFHRARTPNALAPELKNTFPEIEQTVRIGKFGSVLISNEAKQFNEQRFFVADPSIFEIFTFNFLAGDRAAALGSPNSVVLAETAARKYFGEKDPVGEWLMFENRLSLQVQGVFEDLPSNSHFHFDFLASVEGSSEMVDREDWLTTWNNSGFYCYVLLRELASSEEMQAKLPNFVDQHIRQVLDDDEVYNLHLQPLASIHLNSHLSGEIEANGDLTNVYFFSAIGLAILLIACVNYVNLTTARSAGRAREVGLRKAVGADRRQLVKQFLGESIGLSVLAGVLAFGIVELSQPIFNKALGLEIPLHLASGWVGLVLALAIIVGLLSGAYPALFLSSFQPVKVLRGDLFERAKFNVSLRSILVVLQFTASVILITCTMIINTQLNYMRAKSLGFDQQQVLAFPLKGDDMIRQYQAIRNELLKSPLISTVSFSSGLPGDVRWHSTAKWGEGNNLEVNHIMVDHDFLDLYGMQLVRGRGFLEDLATDATGAYILNEAAVRAIGWEEPLAKKLTLWGREGEVVGVVKDFHFESLHKTIEPLVFHIRPEWFRTASIRINSPDTRSALDFVEKTWKAFSPNRPFEFTFLDENFFAMYTKEARLAKLVGYFTILAIFVACLGLFGLTSHLVEQRAKEMAIRRVLGASAAQGLHLIARNSLRMVALAVLIGSPIAYLVTDVWRKEFAYRADFQWWIFGLAGCLLLVFALLTVSLQGVKATLKNPVESLRCD